MARLWCARAARKCARVGHAHEREHFRASRSRRSADCRWQSHSSISEISRRYLVSDPAAPPVGSMYLYNRITPPLLDGSYHFNVQTNVKVEGNPEPLPAADNYFNIDGPRFSLPPSEVAGVFPPNNGHGDFSDTIAHIALTRRTLPWERDPQLPPPLDSTGAELPGIKAPWLAL